MPTVLYLVRHAQSAPNEIQPDSEILLSSKGVIQSGQLVPVLNGLGVRRLYCSPYRRCLETLAPFASHVGLDVTVDARLRERLIAPRWLRDFREVWKQSWADLDFRVEGGESSRECQMRMIEAVSEIAERHPGETLALGSHGNAIALLINAMAPDFLAEEASALRNPEIVRFVFDGDALVYDRDFRTCAEFNSFATDFRETPGVIA